MKPIDFSKLNSIAEIVTHVRAKCEYLSEEADTLMQQELRLVIQQLIAVEQNLSPILEELI